MFDRPPKGGTRSGEAATTSRGSSNGGLWRGRTELFTGQTRFFVTFVTFVVDNRGSGCDMRYAPKA